jgi:capsular exopolysaccharide synthesis family protein
MEPNHTQEPETAVVTDVKRIMDLLRRWIWLLVLAVVLGATTTYFVSKFQTPIYQAQTQVMIARSSSQGPVSDFTQALNSQQMTQTYVELLSQRWVRSNVAERVGGSIAGYQVKVSAATNTQIINIVVEGPDPSRAAQIADTFVQVLIEQNESIQSGRYADAEESLDLQIQQMEEQIGGIQVQLEQVRSDALAEQISTAQANIQTTQLAIATAQAEIDKLSGLTMERAKAMLAADQVDVEELQAQLASQLTEQQDLISQLSNDPQIQQDPTLAAALQARLAESETAIEVTRAEIQSLQEEIDWLVPFAEPGIVEKTLTEKQEYLATQQALLPSYQQIYTDLLVSGKIEGTTDKIASLEKNLSLYQQIYLNLLDDRETVRLERMQNMPNVVQLNPAVAPSQPVRPHILTNTIMGGLGSLIMAIAVLFLIEFLDDTIKSADQVNERLKMPVIGYIAEIQRKPETAYVAEFPRSPVSEAFRTLRTNLEFADVDKPIKLLVVVSPNPSEGKSSVAVNLAVTLAQGGKHVLLIDADLRRPRVHRYLGLTNRKGLSDMFRNSASVEQVVSAWKNENLAVITSGPLPPNPADLLASEKMARILKTVREKADIVVIDAPPFLVADASILAARADGVLLVVRPGKTPMDTALFTVEQLKRAGARVLGVVLNRIPRSRAYSYGGYRTTYGNYHKGYGHYLENEHRAAPPSTPAPANDQLPQQG